MPRQASQNLRERSPHHRCGRRQGGAATMLAQMISAKEKEYKIHKGYLFAAEQFNVDSVSFSEEIKLIFITYIFVLSVLLL